MICVYGAGSIGCYVGGRLAAAGADVVLVGRERLARETAAHGLTLTDLRGAELHVPEPDYATVPEAAAGADLVLVTVKSAATAAAAQGLAPHLAPGAVVVSLQNGLRNAAVLREHLPEAVVLPGMVAFNVVHLGEGRFHQGTVGEVAVQDHSALDAHATAFANAGLPLARHADLTGVQAAKLLLNLNNPVNALSGLPLKTQLSQRDYRRCLGIAVREALEVFRAAGIRPAKTAGLDSRLLPLLFGLPDAVFTRAAAKMLAMDPLARSSTWDDLEAGRPTEVDYLNGEIAALAAERGRTAPVNERLAALVHAAEAGGRRDWSGPELLGEVRRARSAAAGRPGRTPNRGTLSVN
ncbi:2-dehydropantoate 2-reductase [Glycomyces sp. TRM65418]|uniref:2-dehydropantoate 2-reductase n=1 Tax=Glycomyces sp. TRM65418 TaxID=2867006 RepID=UPI001CE663C6|nr:2-dehydropantoate 2-reductase [Glycomyces sp. TRM65418]MCC3761833.1 2-dehydropantoate 2-reductase [Glycomyces sp. TRM65418]QZD55915.1 2-dehydropantoate 2-reductase [Glycomyces sp. TRM65418]